ncbi:MAG: acyltransferase [Aquihabitans sp.]
MTEATSGEIDPAALAAAIKAFYEVADDEMRARWARSLPVAEVVLDRWERAERLGFGPGASIYNSALVYGDVSVGERSWIGPNVVLDGSGGGLSIGSWCSISAGVQIYTHDTVAWSLSAGASDRVTKPVSIGDRCHIGAGAVVAPGVAIGDGCVVGAQSFVKSDVPDGVVVAGSPARALGIVAGTGTAVEVHTDPDAQEEARQRYPPS